MNFLLHHHLATRALGSPAAAAGAMLPDLWRMADRRVRAQARRALSMTVEGDLASVLDGIEHHLDTDRWFHADAVFRDGERLAAERLRDAGARAPHIGLFAHILWELCLDGALLRREGFSVVLASLRQSLSAAAGEPAARAVELHHFGRVQRDAGARAAFDARLERICAELARGPWIEGYQTGEGIAKRVEGVRAHLGLGAMSPEERARVVTAMDAMRAEADNALARILTR